MIVTYEVGQIVYSKSGHDKGGIFVIEGIHGLNDLLTASIAAENKFKIFKPVEG